MYLENLVFDALEPQQLGRFWEAVIGGERLTDEPGGFETRLSVPGGPELDLCFQRVSDPRTQPPRIRLCLSKDPGQVDRLLGLGARWPDIDLGEAALLFADPEGNPFSVMQDPAADADSGPVAALRLDSADPDKDAEFWSWLTGWTDVADGAVKSLRHPSRRGPLLEFWPESNPKGATKNRLHLDVRLEAGDDAGEVAASITARGGAQLPEQWGELPWRSYADPSGNEFCLLPVRP